MAGGPLQAADDMVRIISNGVTFGAADKIATALGEKDTAAKTAAARERAGVAGDIASVLGLGGGAKLAFKGLVAVPKIAKAVISKKGAAAAALGIGGLAEYNSRTTPANAAPAKAQAKAPAAKKPNVDAAVKQISDAVRSRAPAAAQPSSFDEMVTKLAAGQDGMISLRQLSALAGAAKDGAQADYTRAGGAKKAPAPGDMAGRMLEQQYIQGLNTALESQDAEAAQQFEEKILQLRKTQFIDPYGLNDGG